MKKYKMPNLWRLKEARDMRSIKNSYWTNKDHKWIVFEKWEVLVSYESVVVVIYKGQVYLGNDYNYSKTTKMYVNNFLWVCNKEFNRNIEEGKYKFINI